MTNRLASSQSLYLRKHAENPIDWWSWCDEAHETAKLQDKPIFLSIGYSSCHWCTVMEGEAFFPLEERYGRPGFLQVLQAIRHYYDTEKQDLQKRKAIILESLLESAVLQTETTAEALYNQLLNKGWETFTGIITRNQQGNSCPMIPYAQMALQGSRFDFESRYNCKQTCTERSLDLAVTSPRWNF